MLQINQKKVFQLTINENYMILGFSSWIEFSLWTLKEQEAFHYHGNEMLKVWPINWKNKCVKKIKNLCSSINHEKQTWKLGIRKNESHHWFKQTKNSLYIEILATNRYVPTEVNSYQAKISIAPKRGGLEKATLPFSWS